MITAQIASIPDRTKMLRNTIVSLYEQVDHINVMLNGYPFTPSFLEEEKITIHHLDNKKGDAAKFYNLPEGIVFLCDDDLIYPTDYVMNMLWKLDEYGGKAIITNHGSVMKPRPIKNYYGSYDRVVKYHCLSEVLDEVEVEIGGTGVMCFDTSYFKCHYNEVNIANVADLWVAKWAKEQKCKIVVNPHAEDWIIYQDPERQMWTIWGEFSEDPTIPTAFYNSF